MNKVRIRNLETREIEPGIPTMRLWDAGGGEAYSRVLTEGEDPVWYLKDDGYESPDGKYVRVAIEHIEEWRVDVNIQPLDPSVHEDEEDYDDWFVVEAATADEARELGRKAAAKDLQERYGCGGNIVVNRVREGGLFAK